jgi:hypothetical protein
VLTPDVAGAYVVGLVTGGTAPGTDSTTLDAYNLTYTTPVNGSFGTGSFTPSGSVSGPAGATYRVGTTNLAPEQHGRTSTSAKVQLRIASSHASHTTVSFHGQHASHATHAFHTFHTFHAFRSWGWHVTWCTRWEG